jgi:hypothetical protein
VKHCPPALLRQPLVGGDDRRSQRQLGALMATSLWIWLVPLLPLLAAAAIAMRMLFAASTATRQEPFTAGLASGSRARRACFCSCSSTSRRWSTAVAGNFDGAPANGWPSA